MAAEDVKPKKRKGAADAAPKPKKQKKTEDTVKLAKATTSAENVPESAPSKKGRKRAADFFVDDSVANEETVKVRKPKKKKEPAEVNGALDNAAEALEPLLETKTKSKKQKKAAKEDVELELEPPAEAPKEATKKSKKAKTQAVEGAEAAPPKKSKKAIDVVEETEAAPVEKPKKASKKQKPVKEPTPEVDSDLDAEELDDEDQTAALLAGFESDEDENDPEADENFSEVAKVAIDKKTEKQLAKAGKNSSNPGVVYVGRIPHGFFEPQMKAYFSQFGTVTKLRLSRNKKTGASKHYAFVEFASEEVADIVARTMDKYLLFGHILQCKVIPSEQIHENLFDGANRRFKTMPRNKMAGLQMARGAERDQWEKRVKLEKKKRNAKNKKLKEEFGYEFTAPALKSVDDVLKKTPALENGETEQLLIVAHTENVGDLGDEKVEPKAKKTKKTKNSAKADVEGSPAVDLAEEAPVVKEKKAKKEKKPKAEVLTVADGEGTDDLVPEVKSKTKSKKTNVVEVAPAFDAPIKERKRKVTTIEQEGVKIKKVKKVKA